MSLIFMWYSLFSSYFESRKMNFWAFKSTRKTNQCLPWRVGKNNYNKQERTKTGINFDGMQETINHSREKVINKKEIAPDILHCSALVVLLSLLHRSFLELYLWKIVFPLQYSTFPKSTPITNKMKKIKKLSLNWKASGKQTAKETCSGTYCRCVEKIVPLWFSGVVISEQFSTVGINDIWLHPPSWFEWIA